MKKSYVIIAIILVMLSTSSAFAYASGYNGESSPRYSYIMDIATVLLINNEGSSTTSITVTPRGTDTVDRMTATVTIRNLDTGIAVVTWREQPFSASQFDPTFNLILGYRLPSRGTYIMEASISLYDGSILRERVSVTSNVASF